MAERPDFHIITGGPGSGKTRVLTYRIAHLLEQGVAPWEILTLTFTNKAAREMKERIEKVVGPKVQSVWAGTFHSIFARILRAEASKIGFPGSFSIYDTDDTTSLLRAIIKEMNLDPNAYNASAIRSRISIAKSNLLSPKAYRDNEEMMQQDRQAKRPYLVDVYEKYVARCQRSGFGGHCEQHAGLHAVVALDKLGRAPRLGPRPRASRAR